jgi:hypothetical protein
MVLSLFALNAKKGRYADMWNIQTEQEDDTKEETVFSRNDSEQFNFVGTKQVILLRWEVLPLNTQRYLVHTNVKLKLHQEGMTNVKSKHKYSSILYFDMNFCESNTAVSI